MCLSKVVFPEPRKPESNVTGSLESSVSGRPSSSLDPWFIAIFLKIDMALWCKKKFKKCSETLPVFQIYFGNIFTAQIGSAWLFSSCCWRHFNKLQLETEKTKFWSLKIRDHIFFSLSLIFNIVCEVELWVSHCRGNIRISQSRLVLTNAPLTSSCLHYISPTAHALTSSTEIKINFSRNCLTK